MAAWRAALATALLMQAWAACAGGGAGSAGRKGGTASASSSAPLSLPPSFQRSGQPNLAGASRARLSFLFRRSLVSRTDLDVALRAQNWWPQRARSARRKRSSGQGTTLQPTRATTARTTTGLALRRQRSCSGCPRCCARRSPRRPQVSRGWLRAAPEPRRTRRAAGRAPWMVSWSRASARCD